MKHRFIVCLACILLAILFLPDAMPHAEKTGKTVRVGWYESAFHHTDTFGRRSGYGYEYQQRIAAYTGWEYEYVEGSWSELFEMLVEGKIDLLSDVSYTEERAEKILYSSESMGSEDYHAFIAPDNSEIRPDDFSTMDGKRVGVNKNSIQEQLFIEWAAGHNVHPEIIELSGRSPELITMLKEGAIDVLVTLDIYGSTSDMVPVCKTGSSDIHFGISKNRQDLKTELDVAMNRILEENRYYNKQLAEKYEDGQGINSFLTPGEKEWLEEHGTIRVGYQKNYLPFCDEDAGTGTLTGFLADYLALARNAERNSELVFEANGYDSVQDAINALSAGEIDCVFPVNLSVYDGERLGVLITDPLVVTVMYAAVRTADRQGISKNREMTVAIPQGNLNFEKFILDHFPGWKMNYYETSKAGFEAVASGEADCILINNYRMSVVSDICDKYKLMGLSTGETGNMSIAVRREDDSLYSILNKVTHQIPGSAVNSSLTSNSFSKDRVTIREFIRDNLIYVAVSIGIVLVVIISLLFHSARVGKRASERRKLISETERDRLTDLYNQNYFFVYADKRYQEQPDKPMDAMAINIDRFHTVNTLKGRDFGDEVLHLLGNEINQYAVENEGIAGRFGSDRFDIYCRHVNDYQTVLDRLQSRVDDAFHHADIRLRMGVMPWEAGLKPEQMFDLARSACSMVRGEYKRHLMVYDEKLRRQEHFNQHLLNDLGLALEAHEIEVFYQPKFDIRPETPELAGAEALIRWRHPEIGLIMPSDFIPLFEKSGQISTLDQYVWDEAARQISVWKKKYGVALPLSVNLSRVDVFAPELMETLDAIVLKYGLTRKDLKLEITESAYTENADYLIRVIRKLRESGYQIEMDDFGTGYSSLNMLSAMPIDILKMDKEFIRNIEHDEKDIRLVELILDIAGTLKVPVIAEGVETKEQLILLRKLGCAMVQGFYFSRPLPAEEFAARFFGK